jgi:hypothetical protein
MSNTLGQALDEALSVDDFIQSMLYGLYAIGNMAEAEVTIEDPTCILHAVDDLSYLLGVAIRCKNQQKV